MKNILRKLHLIDNFTVEVDIDKRTFVDIFENNIDKKRSDLFDIFSSSKNHYKGIVNQDNFEIKRINRFFDSNQNFSKAKGTMIQKDSRLDINIEINAFQGQFKFMFISMIISFAVVLIILSSSDRSIVPGSIILFMTIVFIIMLGIPYFIMRRGLERFKYDLERDLYFMTKK